MELRCPFPECQAVLTQKSGDKYIYWTCPECGARLNPGREVDIWRLEQAYKHMLAKKGGSSKKAGRKRESKKKIKKWFGFET